MNDNKILEISWGTIARVFLAIVVFYLAYRLQDILVSFIFALIISILFAPAIRFLKSLKIPHILAVIFLYVAVFGIFGLVIYWTIPVFVNELQQFSQLFPQYFEKLSPPLRALGISAFENIESFSTALEKMLANASQNVVAALSVLFGGIGATFFVFSISLFLSIEEKGLEKVVAVLTPRRYEPYVLSLLERSEEKVSAWFGSRILTSLFVGVAVFITLYLFRINYSLTLSLFAAVLDFIPIFGPIIAGALAFFFVLLDDWLKAIFILVIFILIQQVEGNIVTPFLTKKVVGVPPVVVLLALAIGGELSGFLGAVLAVPLAGIIYEFSKDFLKKRKDAAVQVF